MAGEQAMVTEGRHPASPSVFISSTVGDLRDLRSALRHTLRAQGANVFLSEAADFDVRGDRSAVDECFANIRSSDHYILVIGGNRGNLFSEGCSITRQEYRVAREEFVSKGQPILHFYLRDEVEVATSSDEATQRVVGIDDPSHLCSFIDEVQNPGSEGVPNYLTRFRDFEELIESVKGRLNLGRTLSETLIRHALASELASNLAAMVRRHGTYASPHHLYMAKMREEISISPSNLSQTIVLCDDHVISLILALVGRAEAKDMRTRVIEESMDRGIFLTFNPTTGLLEESPVHEALKQILEDVQALRELDDSPAQPQWDRQLLTDIKLRWGGRPHSLEVGVYNLVLALKHFDYVENVFNDHLALCKFLLGTRQELESYDRRPLTPLGEKEAQKIRAERVSPAEVVHLIQNDIWPLGPRVLKQVFGENRDEQMQRIVSDYLNKLKSLGIDVNGLPDITEALTRAAQDYLDNYTASPEEGIDDLRSH